MAYIAPNSILNICNGMPFEKDYSHTVLFGSAGGQAAAIGNRAKYSLQPNTYQRVNRNRCRVGIKADNLYDCNYLMFQNTNFGNKWFYAFITAIEYINNECTEIEYEIDAMQSYLFDYTLGKCFVEREHIEVDAFGANIVPENLNVGDLIAYGSEVSNSDLTRLGVFILVATDSQSITDVGNLYDNIFHGGSLFCFVIDQSNPSSTQTAIRTFLSAYNNEPDKILGIWTAPAPNTIATNGRVTTFGDGYSLWSAESPFVSHGTTFGSFTPHNNKMFTYPYNALRITNGQGHEGLYRYELFNDGTSIQSASFRIYKSSMYPAEYTLYPVGYKGVSGANRAEPLSIKGWGCGSWTADTWQRMMEVQGIESSFGAIKGMAGAIASGNPAYGFGSVVSSSIEVMKCLAMRDYIAPTTYGNANTGSALAANDDLTFRAVRVGVTEQFARMIDGYFDMYGYQTNEVKIPNRNSRPHWNYVKAQNVTFATGENIPADHADRIKKAMNNGITFWKSLSEVGEYGYDNRP